MIEPILKAQLERDEGRRLKAYLDTSGYWTIGVGHLLGGSPRMSSITDVECDALLVADIDAAIRAATTVFGMNAPRLLDSPRWRALINMAFNRGEGRMHQSTTITPAIKKAIAMMSVDVSAARACWALVGDAILASEWGKQIKDRGMRLAKQFAEGVDV